MAAILVLIRHGKAQQREEGTEDRERRLTSYGRQALAAGLADELLPLASMPEFLQGETELWSSPALRAVDTAEEVAVVVGAKRIEERDSLYDQDADVFLEEVAGSRADVVIAVGHEPFTGTVAERLCGVALPFKTGSAAFFDLSAYRGTPEDTVLRAFSQGPRTARWKLLASIESMLQASARKARDCMDAFIAAPEDADALHDFRVSVRSLRSQLDFLMPYLKEKQVAPIEASLKELAAGTSAVRDADVFIEQLAASDFGNEELIAYLAGKRKKECARLLGAIAGKKSRKSLYRLFDSAGRLPWKKSVMSGGLSQDDLAARFELVFSDFDEAYVHADFKRVRATHKLRKQAKRLRYVSRAFSGLIGEAADGVANSMVKVQDDLGRLCDARVQCDMIDALPKKKLSADAMAAARAYRKQQKRAIKAILAASSGKKGKRSAIAEESFALNIDVMEHVLDSDGDRAQAATAAAQGDLAAEGAAHDSMELVADEEPAAEGETQQQDPAPDGNDLVAQGVAIDSMELVADEAEDEATEAEDAAAAAAISYEFMDFIADEQEERAVEAALEAGGSEDAASDEGEHEGCEHPTRPEFAAPPEWEHRDFLDE